ncbi:hypothetical protein BJV78DRAFT_1245566 [Lactifluus subvellereus]|nr:hypothetical protein BJV78DRAFT_1245566 [Lactifluus subvellereus]
MFHIVLSIASRFLYLGNMLQGFTRGILALRNLHAISSHLVPTLPPPPPVQLLDAPPVSLELSDEFRMPYPSTEIIVVEPQPLIMPSSIPSYQSSLVIVTPNSLPDLVPLFLMLAIISGFVCFLPEFAHISTTISKTISAFANASSNFLKSFQSKPTSNPVPAGTPSQRISFQSLLFFVPVLLAWTGPPAVPAFVTLVWIMSKFLSPKEKRSEVFNNILQCRGLLIEQDARTPHTLITTYEQISRGTVVHNNLAWRMNQPDKRHNGQAQVMTDVDIDYSNLEVQLENRERSLQQTLAHNAKLEAEEYQLTVQHMYAEFVDSQNSLRRRLEASRTREEKLQADLLAAEQERESLKALIVTLEASEKERREEAEKTTVKLRVGYVGALEGARRAREKLACQKKLVAEKDCIIQSTTEDLRVALARFKDAEDEIARLSTELQREHDRRVRETKELLDEQVRIQDRHKAETHRIGMQAEDAQEQLSALYDVLSRLRAGRRSRGGIRSRRPRSDRTQPYDTGQPPLPPEQTLDTGILPVGLVSKPSSPPFSVNLPRHLPRRDRRDSSTFQTPDLCRISACFGEVSDAARAQRAAMEDFLERMRQLELDRAQEIKSSEQDKNHLQEELAVTREQLRLTQEDLINTRRDLDREKEARRDLETCAKDVAHELDTCQAKLQEVRDARRAGVIKFVEAVELLRLRNADVDSLKVKAEATQFRCSQVTFLSAALRERITDLEAKVKTLKHAQSCPETTPASTNSRLICPGDIDLEAITHRADIPTLDSIYMTIPSSLSFLLDSPLPPSSSQSSDTSLYRYHREASPHISLDTHDADHQNDLPNYLDLSSTRYLPPPSPSEDLSSPPSLRPSAFSSVGNSAGSVDWPPIESALLPADENAQLGDGTSVQTEENADNSILAHQKVIQSSIHQDSTEIILACARPKSPAISILSSTSPDHSLAQVSDKRKLLQRPSVSGDYLDGQLSLLLDNSHGVLDNSEAKGKPSEGLCINLCPLLDNACDAPPNLHRPSLSSTSQGDRSGAPNISTSLFPRRSPIRFPPFGLPPFQLRPFQLPSFQLPPRSIELARLIGQIAPASRVLSEPEDVPMESQLDQAIPVTGYDDGDVSVHSISLDPSSCRFSTGVQHGQVLTLAHREARSSPQSDHDIEMAVDETQSTSMTMAHLRELSLALQSIDTNDVLPSPTSSDISVPSARSLDRPSERCTLPSPTSSDIRMPLARSLERFSERYTSMLDRREDCQLLRPIRTLGQADWRRQPRLSPIPNHLQACGGPTAMPYPESVLTSRQSENIPCALSGLTRPGSPPLRICISADLPNGPISMQSCREAAAPRSSDVFITKPNLPPLALSSPPNHFLPAAQSRLSRLPTPDRRDAPLADSYQSDPLDHPHPPLHFGGSCVTTMVSEDAKSQPVKRLTKSTSPPLPRLLPGLLEPITIRERTLDEEVSLRVSQGPRNGRAANHERIYSRPQDIPKLDYGLPEDFVPGSGRVTAQRPLAGSDFDDFAYIIPLDCPTSTPAASRKRVLEKHSLGTDAIALPTLGPSPGEIARLLSKRKPLEPLDNVPSPPQPVGPGLPKHKTSRRRKDRGSGHPATQHPPDPIFDFFGI